MIDEAGVAHAAASIERDGIFYLTNASGDWTMQRLTEAPGEGRSSGHDGLVWLGLDRDGSLAVAFQRYERWECEPFGCGPREPESAYLLTRVAGTWSSLVDLPVDLPTSLAFIDGHLHHAFAEYGEASQSVFYETDASGSWTRELIGDGEATVWPQLMLASDGTARIAFNGVDRHLYLATQQQDGSFALADVSDTPRYGLMLDASDNLHSSWFDESGDEPPRERYTRLENGSWTEPVLTYPADRSLTDPCDKHVGSTLDSDDVAIGDDGSVYAISRNDPIEAGLWYSTNHTGQFVATQLRPPSYWSPEICDVAVEGFHQRPAQLELDNDGRPHVLFLDGEGLFYTVGPLN